MFWWLRSGRYLQKEFHRALRAEFRVGVCLAPDDWPHPRLTDADDSIQHAVYPMLMHVQLLLVERGERVQQVVSVRQSAIVHDGQFAVNPAPVTNRHRPFLRGLKRRQIERF